MTTNWQRYQKDHPSPQKVKFCIKKIVVFTQKDPPASQKTEVVHEKNDTKSAKKYTIKSTHPRKKTWSFEWKIENRPTYGDFEKKNPDPQLYQTYKPITL